MEQTICRNCRQGKGNPKEIPRQPGFTIKGSCSTSSLKGKGEDICIGNQISTGVVEEAQHAGLCSLEGLATAIHSPEAWKDRGKACFLFGTSLSGVCGVSFP
jgi:hypothetical protein